MKNRFDLFPACMAGLTVMAKRFSLYRLLKDLVCTVMAKELINLYTGFLSVRVR
jgi:hypothetical protein